MTDREMLMIIYGALKAIKSAPEDLKKMLQEHLFPMEKQKK